MADITGDGETEIVGISRRGTSGFVLEVIYPFASTEKIKDIYNIPFRGESRRLAICDLDGSGSNDIAILSTGMSYDFDSIIIYQNDGKGNLKNQNDIWNTDPERRFFYHIACADFDNDGRNDLALTISVNDEVIIYFNETDM